MHSSAQAVTIRLIDEFQTRFDAADGACKLEQLIEGAEVIADVKKAVLKFIDSNEAKHFKKVYKALFTGKALPETLTAAISKAFGVDHAEMDTCEKVHSSFLASANYSAAERLYALMAIAQSSMRNFKSGELDKGGRDVLLAQARDCPAVKNLLEMESAMPPKFAMLLNGQLTV